MIIAIYTWTLVKTYLIVDMTAKFDLVIQLEAKASLMKQVLI